MRNVKSTDQLLTLGMALTTDKKAMERRVRGVFARKTSAKSVIALSLVFALALGFAAFTTACQPGNGLERQREVTFSVASPLHQLLDVPNRFSWEQESIDEMFHYKADLDITMPDVSSVPVARATMREFTQAELENISRVIFGEGAVYTYPKNRTKEYIEDYLPRVQKSLESLQSETEPRIREIGIHQRIVAYYESILPGAPSETEQREIPLLLTKTLSEIANDATGFAGVTVKDGYRFHLIVENDKASEDGYIGASSYVYASMGNEGYCPYFGTIKEAPDGVVITQQQAEQQAKVLALQLTPELQLCYSAPVHGNDVNDRKEGWACVFMRAIDGFPTAFVSAEVNDDIMLDVPYAQAYETMTIIMDDQGLADFKWVNPMTVTSVEHQTTGFLPFQQVINRVPYEIRMRYLKAMTDTNEEKDVTITAITLGLMRIGASGTGSFSYEPVWNIFYEFEDSSKLSRTISERNTEYSGYPYRTNALTLSAIDGRVIDRNTGY